MCFSVNLASLFLHRVKILLSFNRTKELTDGQYHEEQYQIVEEERNEKA